MRIRVRLQLDANVMLLVFCLSTTLIEESVELVEIEGIPRVLSSSGSMIELNWNEPNCKDRTR